MRYNYHLGSVLLCAAAFLILSGQSPSPAPSPAASPTSSGTMQLSSPVTRSLTNVNVAPQTARFQDPDLARSASVEEQKHEASIHALGRPSTGTVIFGTPAPQTGATPGANGISINKAKLLPRHTQYDAETGLRPTPGPTLPQRAPQPPKVMSVDQQFPGDFEDTANPPDTQVAVGTQYVVEVNNSHLTVWSKQSLSNRNYTPLLRYPLSAQSNGSGLFQVPAGYTVADPSMVFDASARRWIISALAFRQSDNSSWIDIAYSAPDDPTAPWTVRKLDWPGSSSILHDQPKLGLTDDKFVIAWDDWQYQTQDDGSTSNVALGGRWAVFSKSDLYGNAGTVKLEGPGQDDICLRNPTPAKNDTRQSTAFIVASMRADSPPSCNGPIPIPSPDTANAIEIVRISGLVGQTSSTKSLAQVAPYSAPADVQQYGSDSSLKAGDTRVQSAIWDTGRLFLAANDACKLALGCFRFLQIETEPRTKVVQDFDVGLQNRALLYPSLVMDGRGDAVAIVSEVSSGLLGAAVFDRLAGHSDWGLTTFKTGKSPIECGAETTIGDYSGADHDPAAPDALWLAVEVPPDTATPINDVHWCPQASVIVNFSIR
jgi:hypothetical protein